MFAGLLHQKPPRAGDKLAKAGVDVNVAEVDPEQSSEPTTPNVSHLTIHQPAVEPELVGICRLPVSSPVERPGTLKPEPFYGRPGGSRSASPTGSVRTSYGSSTRRRVRHSSGFTSGGYVRGGYRSEVSKELTIKAESKFFALMEIFTSASREASSLKEIWMQLISERELWEAERCRMYERIEEFTEIIEKHEEHKSTHVHEHEETKKQLTQVKIELSAAIASITELKRKLSDRDSELEHCRHEIHEYKETISHMKEEHSKTETKLEETQLLLVASQEECAAAKGDAERHHGELCNINQKYLELQSSHSEMKTEVETMTKEISSYKETIERFNSERHEWLHEKGRLDDGWRKCRHSCGDLTRKLQEMTLRYEEKVSEITEITEKITKIKTVREKLDIRIKELLIELEELRCKWQESEGFACEYKLKWEHFESESKSLTQTVTKLTSEKHELTKTIIKKTEEMRLLIIDFESLKEKHHHECEKHKESHRQVLLLKESTRRHEIIIKEKSEQIHTLSERVERIESERDCAVGKNKDLEIELTSVQATIISLRLEITTLTESRDCLKQEIVEWESKYESVQESMTEYHESSGEFEYELENMRCLLREAREQKEKAITARNSADRERDEAILKYEEKCRELERWEEERSLHYHAHGRTEEKRSVTRSFYKGSSTATSTAVNGGHSHGVNGHHIDY